MEKYEYKYQTYDIYEMPIPIMPLLIFNNHIFRIAYGVNGRMDSAPHSATSLSSNNRYI